MSILGTHNSEDLGGRGKPLPNAKYRGTIESAQISPEANGTRLVIQIGQLTTPEGATEMENGGSAPYRIGNRKVFVREWLDHSNEQATKIGQRRLTQLLIAVGIIAKPARGETVSDPFDTAEQLAAAVTGQTLLFTSKQRTRMTKEDGKLVPVYEDDGTTPKMDVEVAAFHAP